MTDEMCDYTQCYERKDQQPNSVLVGSAYITLIAT